MMRAIVFVRRSGAKGAGHVGWAFECGGGAFNVGSIENPRHSLRTQPGQMGFWATYVHDPIAPMRRRAYTHFKVIDIPQANPQFAGRVVAWLSHHAYDVFGHNCMNATYDVLRAFGVGCLPAPAHHWEPNHWFNHVQGREYRINAQDVILDLHNRERDVDVAPVPDAASLAPNPIKGMTPAQPSWRTPQTPEWRALQQAMAIAPPMPPAGHWLRRYPDFIARIVHRLSRAARHVCSGRWPV